MHSTNIEDLPSNLLSNISNYLAIRDRVKINIANRYLHSCTLPSVWIRIDFTKATRDINEVKKYRKLIRHAVVKDLEFVETQLVELGMLESLEVVDGIEFTETNFLKLSRLNLVRLETIKLTQSSLDTGFSWFSSNRAFSTLSSISVEGSDPICLELLRTIVTTTRIRLTDLKLNLDTLSDDLMSYIISQFSELNSLSISTKFDTLSTMITTTTDNLGDIQGLGLEKVDWTELNLKLAYHNENLVDHIPLLNGILNSTTLHRLTRLSYLEHFTQPNSSTSNALTLNRVPNLKHLVTNISIENIKLVKVDLVTLKLVNQELNPITLKKLSGLETLKRLVINSGGIKSLNPIYEPIVPSNLAYLELSNHCLTIENLIHLMKWTPNLVALTLSQLAIPSDSDLKVAPFPTLTQLNINHQMLANSEYIRSLVEIMPHLKKLWIDLKFSLYPTSLNQLKVEFDNLKFDKE